LNVVFKVQRWVASWQAQPADVTPPIQWVVAYALTDLLNKLLGGRRRFWRLVVILVLVTVLVVSIRIPLPELPPLPAGWWFFYPAS
jgi:uncharacterized membrane protein